MANRGRPCTRLAVPSMGSRVQVSTDGSLDLTIEVGHQVPVALGRGADRLVMTGHLGGGVHGPGGGGQQRCPCRKPHPCSSCRMVVLVKHPTESVASSYI